MGDRCVDRRRLDDELYVSLLTKKKEFMKSTITLLTSLLLVLSPLSLANAKTISIRVKGMVCAFCAQGIEKKFKALPEISKVKVNLESKRVDLDTTAGKDVSDESITKIITAAGYDVLNIERPK